MKMQTHAGLPARGVEFLRRKLEKFAWLDEWRSLLKESGRDQSGGQPA
jgi:hypothetical protein